MQRAGLPFRPAALASFPSAKAAHITPSPFQGEGGDGGARREPGHAPRQCTPTLALPLKRGRERNLDRGNGRTVVGPTAEPGVYLKLN